MPKVGKMKFPYTEQGMRDAQNYSKQSGKPMQVEGNYRHGGKVMPKYNLGGLVRGALANKLAGMYKDGGKVAKQKTQKSKGLRNPYLAAIEAAIERIPKATNPHRKRMIIEEIKKKLAPKKKA